jgi:GGDEF domain-containing protein
MERTIAQLFRLTIARKLLLGFLSCGILTILIALIALFNLQRLNEINNRIIKRDIPLAETANEAIDTLLAQELYGRRSLILKSSEMEALFWKRSDEFEMFHRQIGNLPDVSDLPLDQLTILHREYNRLYQTGFEKRGDFSSSAFQDHDRLIRRKQEELFELLKGISRDARLDQSEKSLKTMSIGHSAFWNISGLSIVGLLLGILIALVITRNISRSIKQLESSTREISEGKFDQLPKVRNQDELGDLSQAFQRMAQRLKSLEETHLDANPLTYLPGSITIENVLNKRLKKETPTAFCQLDLSNFKAFNDRYGYARGNEVLQVTANIVTEVVKTEGNEGDFVGHIGGDDFVVITSPERYEKICRAVIDSFDKRASDFYDLEDRQRGCIHGETRQGQKVSFPIMTMAISVVTNQYCPLQNHVQVGEIAAEVKSYAKSFPHSTFAVDHRGDNVSPQAESKTLPPPELGE